ncbi:MAG: leucyl aminopeptidase [Cardiobacteriaceae bacterium]|nr:leucyl aminopeptidase [Cardiobacteriaceae bacterium]
MKWVVKNSKPEKADAQALVVFVGTDGRFAVPLAAVDAVTKGVFRNWQEKKHFPTEAGEAVVFHDVEGVEAGSVVVCALDDDARKLDAAAQAVAKLAQRHEWKKVALSLPEGIVTYDDALSVFAKGLGRAAYSFDTFKSEGKAKAALGKVSWQWLVGDKKAAEETLCWVDAWVAGTHLARELGDLPPNVCNPAYLGDRAKKLADEHDAVSAKVLKRKDIEALGMGALLGVAQGSNAEPRFIIMEYKPKNAVNTRPVVLVGKGVTFDTGGISLKPADGMELMKYDMGGAAAVFGTLAGLCEAKAPVHVVALIPAVENMPGGKATRPGDIVTSMSGKTIEVINTDAEGRLILCDALTYAERYEPQAVIDMATLTGACVVALGSVRAGLMGNDEALVEALFSAGEAARDLAWKMPLDTAYREMMKSSFADFVNASAVREAGTLTAGAFLGAFAEKYPWAHLDIAGVAWGRGIQKGGTGRPVGLLLEYFRRLAA